MIELCDYIYKTYPQMRKFAYWQLLSLLDRNEDKIVFVKENGEFKGAALYVKLEDDAFRVLKSIPKDEIREVLSVPEFIQALLNENGNHIHFLYVVADGMTTIKKGIRKVKEKEHPHTISWYKPGLTKFKIVYRRQNEKVCQTS